MCVLDLHFVAVAAFASTDPNTQIRRNKELLQQDQYG